MVGIDTNVLVRFVTQDDETQFLKVSQFLNQNCTEESPGWISSIVLCELVWVLSSGYGYKRSQIGKLLNQLLVVTSLRFENRTCVRTAVEDFVEGNADFSDYLIAASNQKHGCSTTVTLDKKAGKHPGFHLL
ncbi:PIN domain-containing protein [Pelagicoccus albus]|uniref:Type II toxin-antitoxin system VapC family toxin n=1 Tax=Pelagicoccus albus TaxID=415222 RepID=A0A7X1B4W3_9BACT|nr:type II toxin-antitoxin system VapC family toxin [Pelagicoccus albus]MBC2604440.1 type II toxin-antitoxin system VapC family toxin [Pelagicoccus albus]